MLQLMEIEEEDDSIERVNLDDYNSKDYKEYASNDNMLDDQATAQAKATPDYRSHPPPPTVTVTVKLEYEN